MTKKSSKKALSGLSSYQLAHAIGTSLRSENRAVLAAIKTLVKTVEQLDKRLTRTEAKIERTATSLRVHRGAHKPRVNKRYVSHKIGKAEKAHLCEVWAANRQDPAKLKAEGKVLAKRYKLHYDRQVVKWFKVFESWTKADTNALIKTRVE
jgi:hypothetical protein